jgi:hypothetical protein
MKGSRSKVFDAYIFVFKNVSVILPTTTGELLTSMFATSNVFADLLDIFKRCRWRRRGH